MERYQYEIEIPFVLPSANAQLRMHFRARKRLKVKCMEYLLVAKSGAKRMAEKFDMGNIWPEKLKRFHLTIERHAVQAQDGDNAVASHKPLIDALKVHDGMSVIADDGPNCMLSVNVIHVAAKRKNQRTVMRFTEG